MRGRKLTRWQKASAVVPIALLVGASGAALTDTNLATARSGADGVDGVDPGVPKVPTTAFQQPASVQAADRTPSGIDPKAGPQGTLSTLSSNGIPAASLLAYKRTETLLDKADPACHLPWTLVAAIGRVESDHGRFGGNAVGADGVSRPGVFGVPLDGSNNTARVSDSDGGALDNDPVWDRAVGPLQFIPSTWYVVGVDGNGDGEKNPQDINDAALASGVYLCAGEGDLGTDDGARSAVMRYNHSNAYVDLVLSIAKAYAAGDFSRSPNGIRSPALLTSHDNDQTLPGVHDRPKHKSKHHKNKAKGSGGSGNSTGGAGTSGDSDGSTSGGSGGGSSSSGSGGGSSSGSGSGDAAGDAGKQVKKAVKDTGDTVHKTVKDAGDDTEKTVIGAGKAAQICATELNRQYGSAPQEAVNTCADRLVGKTLSNAQDAVDGVVSNLESLVDDLLGGVTGGLGL